MRVATYVIFVVVDVGLIYPFPCHWVWSEGGWLYGKVGDFAGASVVHIAGGAAAFAGKI